MKKYMLNKYKDIALSDDQLLHLIDNKANLILYPDLHNYTSLDQLLYPYNSAIILYESKPNYGHWTCIFKHKNTVEFFNSYGSSPNSDEGFPDQCLNYIPDDFRIASNQVHTYLSHLMYNSPYKLTYNEYPFQSHEQGIKTCGRHVAMRLLYSNLSLKKYKELMDKLSKKLNMDYDDVVSLITSDPSQLQLQH